MGKMIDQKRLSIWFFIGSLLTVYGIVILGMSIYNLFNPLTDSHVVLSNLHAGLWWGALLLIIGLIYVFFFRPGRVKK
jgi:hypothetical protein